ncbi:McrC family protein [Lutimaribacter sp. EGI FJ00015]|uniref:McrC family protein n=1 Tax=Lutimaribacter degradans TaxID=2945989 RepID=A0ACC5ZTU6_9RHOB|nr:McrC family protein [Lutimaribacter sp. EGI FJ00013]MCM2561746.1 McrC family protein [Lutimaribacter sp. EGI FJ00013]MCO0613222.1 McrC family protein [Lutimaribacter sp. EGI FJ00015]MCO0635578.1 McrC family protein [Lutimaribacter sp. EGI FJ00014]
MREWQRITATEYAKPAALAEQIARKSDISVGKARELLLGAGERVRGMLGLDAAPIALVGDKVQFQNFAGLLVLARGLELEVAPKFLGDVEGWREDFFLLATLSHHGRLLDDEGLQAAAQANSDLATLIGRSLVEMYWRNHRRPLRTYRRLRRTEFAIDGDYDPEDLITPAEDGFVQEVTSFTRINPYNGVIRAAAAQLAPVVPDAETRARLERVAENLPRQRAPSRLDNRQVPSRARSWQPTYDLSLDILRGLGGAYDPRNALAPGFVMTTWQVWEHLVSIALRSGMGGKNVSIQAGHRLGVRMKGTEKSPLTVYPDALASVHEATGIRKVIIDAKYKGHVERRGAQSVSNADIYEALAFSRATAVNDVVLAYPKSADPSNPERCTVGNAVVFSNVTVEDVNIRAVELGVCGISRRDGLKKFVTALSGVI